MKILLSLLFSLFFATEILASARVIVDTPNVDFGYMREDAISKDLHRVFLLKNDGKDTLKITKVKPSCGCTSESHDSIIPPGGTGKISATIRKNTLHGGKFTKSIRVESNAENAPLVRLTMTGEILSPINFPKLFVRFVIDSTNIIDESFTITSDIKNLKINKVQFKEGQNANSQTGSKALTVELKSEIKRIGKNKDNDFYKYQLKIFAKDIKISDYKIGKFTFETNHPKKKTFDIRGMLTPPHGK